jgi:LacI family repressor for deo operon, udp, cdd, tsx, nupC, and nupG
MGRRAFEVLSVLMRGESLSRIREILPFQLVERQSSGPVGIP